MKLRNFEEAKDYLYRHIPENPQLIFSGGRGLNRTKYLLRLLGNPQDKLKVIHIAGTSGKSSTSYLLSLLLKSQGKQTGLFVSPHIFDIRERIRLNNELISKNEFVECLNDIVPFIEETAKSSFGESTYFEILTVMAFYFFLKKKVDYAVIETGLGGLLDATNVIRTTNKLCIITKLGYDHMEILGNSLAEIAAQKAGIITKNSIVLTLEQAPEAEKILSEFSQKNRAQIFVLKDNLNFKNVRETKDMLTFDFSFQDIFWGDLSLGLIGLYQAQNCSLALAALTQISK